MARLAFVLTLLISTFSSAMDIFGTWQFTEMIYRGQRIPRPSEQLFLTWTFFENGTSRLYWDRGNKSIFCERFANYELKDGFLAEKSFSINPKNAIDCQNDPDMQPNANSKTSITFNNGEIFLHLNMSGEELIYILTRLNKSL